MVGFYFTRKYEIMFGKLPDQGPHTVVVTERDHRKMNKGSENADGKSVVNSSSGGSIKHFKELDIYRRDLGFVKVTEI